VERGRTGEAALEELNRAWQQCARARRWPCVPETHEQTQFVQSWVPGADPATD